MRRKQPEIDFEQEAASEVQALWDRIGKEVPLSMRYSMGPRATLVSIYGELAELVFPNGARLTDVPLRDLVDDSCYWKR